MRGVMLEVPADLLQARLHTDAGRFDEMWEGVLHMVPPPSAEHQRVETELLVALYGPAGDVGLQVRLEIGLFDPDVADASSYRQPDVVLFGDESASERGVEGAAALVIEVRSPGDESFEKLPFYDRVGVAEVLVIDRDSKELRHWVRTAGGLADQPLPPSGELELHALPASICGGDGTLRLTTAAGTTSI